MSTIFTPKRFDHLLTKMLLVCRNLEQYFKAATINKGMQITCNLLLLSIFTACTAAKAETSKGENTSKHSIKSIRMGLNKGGFFKDESKKSVRNWSSNEHKSYMSELGIRDASLHYNINLARNRKNPLDWIYKNYINKGIDTTVTLLMKVNKGDPESVRQKANKIWSSCASSRWIL